MSFTVVGQRLPRLDGPQKVRGEARYTEDLSLPGMLCGKILRSPLPHARILSIDADRARRLPGVKAVIVGGDTAGVKYGVVSRPPRHSDKLPLAIDKVRHIGDEVAAVAAIDEETAEEALQLIRVDYEELPALFDPTAAMAEGAVSIHDHARNNVCNRISNEYGEVDVALGQADYVREDRFVTQAVAHAPLEPHVSLAAFDAAGSLTLWTSTQTPYYVQRHLAATLQLPLSSVRVIKPQVGGGFGGKSDGMAPLDFCAALLSLRSGRPVRIAYSREEEFVGTSCRHATTIDLKSGMRRDGTLLVRDCQVILDGGAYASWGPVTNWLCSQYLHYPYRLPHCRYLGYRVYTNKPPRGAQRGHGAPQIHFAVESQMDLMAEELGIDPVEIRLKNALHTGEVTRSGAHIVSSGFDLCLRRAAEQADWRERWRKLPRGRGIGIGCSAFLSGAGQMPVADLHEAHSSALIEVGDGGQVTLLTGAADNGQGSDTVLCQIAAEGLGVPLERIRLVTSDTLTAPLDLGSYASRTTLMAGRAILAAVEEVKGELFRKAAELLEANPVDLVAAQGEIWVGGSRQRAIPFERVVEAVKQDSGGRPLVGRGHYNPPADRLNPTYSFSVQIAEVEVDEGTGEVRVLRIVSSHDCGRAINPMSVEGQLEGSIHMALGQTLSEAICEEDGQICNPGLLGYLIPTAREMPAVEMAHVDVDDPEGPFGAKEAGEGTVGPTAPAIVNAIHDAVGIRLKELPVTPDKLLQALSARRGGKGR